MISRIELNGLNIDCENLGDIQFEYSQSSDPACFQIIESINNDLVFVGDAFEQIVLVTNDQCQKNTIVFYESCEGVESSVFNAFFTLTNCSFNFDICKVEVSLENDTLYDCFVKSWGNDINILQTPIDPATSVIEYPFFNNLEYTTSQTGNPIAGFNIIGQFSANSADPLDPDYIVYIYGRVVTVTACLGGVPQAPDSNTSWYLVDNTCSINATAKWARPAIIGGSSPDVGNFDLSLSSASPFVDYNPANTGVPGPPPSGMNNPILVGFEYIDLGLVNNYGLPIGTYTFYVEQTTLFGSNPIQVDNGRLLVDVIQYMLDQQGCGLTVKSEFYGTAGFENDPNYVTGKTNNPMSGLVLFQKSDVADPSASENATIANISIETLLTDLNVMHYTFWQIDESTNELVIEHWSKLNNLSIGLDLLDAQYIEYSRYNNSVTFSKAEVPEKEEFNYAVPSPDVDFNGLGITYNTQCSGAGTVKVQTQQICTDWVQVLNNEEFETEGLMLVQPESLSPSGSKAENGRVTGVFKPNAPLGYGATLEDYYTYNRPTSEGTINNNIVPFDSTKRIKNLKPITIPFCCALQDANLLVNTQIGQGLIQEALYTPSKAILELNIILEL